MKQYAAVKAEYQDCIVLFRLGDFYEMFGEDAETASKILQIALTTREKSRDNPIPMCGVPYFAAETYITKLIKSGHKVAICEQMEDPRDAKGIVAREVVKVITPGTHTPESPKENAYIISIFPLADGHGIAAADISTGTFMVYQTAENIEDEAGRFEPKEILLPASLKDSIHYQQALTGFYISAIDDWVFDYHEAYRTLLSHFRVSSLEGYGCEDLSAAISAAGALIQYLEGTQKVPAFKTITTLQQAAYLFMDAPTQRNLELTHNLRDGSRESTLLWALDETLSPMGGRLLRAALLRPLTDLAEINRRHAAIEYLIDDFELLETLRTSLRTIQDLERLASRVVSGTANARDMIAIKSSLASLPKLKKTLSASKEHLLKSLSVGISEFSLLKELIEKAIVDNPPPGMREGGIIKEGFHAEVDALRHISSTGKDFITELELSEKKKTGISSLKIGFNRIFGYYIEVTKSNLDMVPEHYIRKQTLVGGERFITPELKDYEDRVLGSEEKLKNLEQEVFQQVLASVREESGRILNTANVVALLDLLSSLAVVAKRHNYTRPLMVEECIIDLSEARHPVLERAITGERFVPNNTAIDMQDSQLLILTGPNMAGKSTYMRQVALIVLMAQAGSFVPAASAKIGVADRIFTRIGASDFLSKGQSTFMVEMIEVANIVNNATEKSLIILDEVGRGTSTFDGISIAWALAEHILNRIKARTLFATHYNELTELARIHDGVKNYNISVREWGEEIVFLRKIEEGPADKSYGIQVARLAGVPDTIIARAKEVLYNLQNESLSETGKPRLHSGKPKKRREQLDLFSSAHEAVINEIIELDADRLSPEEARSLLLSLSSKLRS